MSTSYQELLERLVESFRLGSVTVWCGAGVCIPSGLPDTDSFVAEIARLLDITEGEQRKITDSIPSRRPFEHFVELVVGSMDEKARTDLLRLFKLGSPCHYHDFLAEIARKRFLASVVTTNFDRHIETAFDQQQLTHDSDYRVYHGADQLKNIDWKATHLPVVKLHGSVDDIENLGVTLRRVASPGASKRVVPAMRHIFGPDGAEIVLVLGYSFSDKFDILPAIRGLLQQDELPLLVILDYRQGHPLRVLKIKDREEHPLENYPGGLIVEGDSFEVVYAIAARLGLKISRQEHEPAWRNFVTEYISELDKRNQGVAKPHLAGTLLEAVGDHEPALRYFEAAVEAGDRTDEARWQYGARVSLSGPMIRLGRTQEASSILEKAIELIPAEWRGQHSDVALGRLAEIHLDLGLNAVRQALALYERSRMTAAGGPDRLREVPYLSGIATCWTRLGDLDAAQNAYRQALELVESSGDLYREAELYGNIASLASIVRDYQAARQWYERAIDISRSAGDLEKVGLHTMNLANVEVKEGHAEKAIERYGEARELLAPFKPATDSYLELIEEHVSIVRKRLQQRGT